MLQPLFDFLASSPYGRYCTFAMALALGILLFHRLHKSSNVTIRKYIAKSGGSVISVEWDPCFTGEDRVSDLYKVVYRDADGQVKRATCRALFMGGVEFVDPERRDRRYED